MAPCAFGRGWGARFDLLYESGGYRTRGRGTETCVVGRRLLTASNTHSRSPIAQVDSSYGSLSKDRDSNGSDSASSAIEEVSVVGIESKADRISVPVILESLHI
jgi:hypothetical protein